ncbi:MAG: hypothetical protein ACI9MC_000947 [Kiritimatiellia bacterium]|jgi:hypothetical protein
MVFARPWMPRLIQWSTMGTTARPTGPASPASGVHGRLLELAEPSPAWMGAAHAGHLTLPDGSIQPIVALLGPENTAPDALSRARRAAAVALTLRHPGVLRLCQVAGWNGRVAWCYQDFEGICLSRLGEVEGAAMPARAAAEVVAQVAEVLLALGHAGLEHGGPELPDLLLSRTGKVQIAGFAGPFPSSPAMRAPNSDAPEAATVYRLGVLLAILISGASPVAGVDASAHSVTVRRALIRAMSRPGPVLSERYGQWVRGMLAWAPSERPPLSAVPSGLRAVAWATGGAGIAEWSELHVPDVLQQVFARADAIAVEEAEELWAGQVMVVDGPPPRRRALSEELTASRVGYPTEEHAVGVPRPKPLEDDPTQEATIRPVDMLSEPPSIPPMSVSGSLIPVNIGPPAEVVARRPSLPPGFLDQEKSTADLDDRIVSMSAPVIINPRTAPAVFVLIVCLGILAVVALAYLLIGGRSDGRPHATGPGLQIQVDPGDQAVVPVVLDVDTWIPPEAEETDTDLSQDEVEEPPLSALPASTEDASSKPNGYTVLFRLAGGQPGTIAVQCELGERGSAVGQVRLWGLKNERCTVWTHDPSGARLKHVTTISGAATVDCFHNWESSCLD